MKNFPNTLQKEFTATPDKYPQKRFKDKACKFCGIDFKPLGPSHHYCSDRCRKYVYADKHYRRTYNVSILWVLAKLKKQDYRCAICRTSGFKMLDTHISGMNLDHCHATGIPRALLCHNCNRGLGLFQDNPEYLRSAANYLEVTYESSRDEELTPGQAETIIREIESCQKKG